MINNRKVGVEAEFFLLNSKDEAVVVPSGWDRDSFTVLGEIRGEPGDTPAETIGNFSKRQYEVESMVTAGRRIVMEPMRMIRLAVYRKAMQEMNAVDKYSTMKEIHNVYGTDISEFSDQIVKGGKIQGAKASCGLHIHFSCMHKDERTIEEQVYSYVQLPIDIGGATTTLSLWKKDGYKKKKTIKVSVSLLTKPAIEWIVRTLDDTFFKRFAPSKDERTKYRQPGFYELKPYGFEYRSLPATSETIKALPEIVEKAHKLLRELSKTSW